MSITPAGLRLKVKNAVRSPFGKALLQQYQTTKAYSSNRAHRPNRTSRKLKQAILKAFNDDFDQTSSQRALEKRKSGVPNFDYSGVYGLLLVNFTIFAADHFLHAPWHLSNNAFMLLVFGRIVEEEEGTFGVWATYILCAVGASIASVLMQPRNMVSLGASGAVFGMFAVSVLTKLQFKFRKLLEFGILGQFVLQQVLNEAKMQSQVWSGGQGLVIAGTQVGHLAHLAGAFVGVMLVFLLSKIPAPAE